MIGEALNCLANEINAYFGTNAGLAEDPAIVAAIVNSDGSIALNTANKITITLVNLEADPHYKNTPSVNDSIPIHLISPLNINLYVLITANFSNYELSLKILFGTISFLQEKSSFNQSNSKWLNGAAEQFQVEMVNMNFEDLHNLWTSLGTSYRPSVVYRISGQ